MPKRAFTRRSGVLVDEIEHFSMPASCLDEPLATTEREHLIASMRAGGPGIHALDLPERQEDLLEPLLEALSAGSSEAPMPLLMFIDDPRVQPALVAATRAAPLGDIANFAQALTFVGGPGACEVLRDRLDELMADERVLQPAQWCNELAADAIWLTGHVYGAGLRALAGLATVGADAVHRASSSSDDPSAHDRGRAHRSHPARAGERVAGDPP